MAAAEMTDLDESNARPRPPSARADRRRLVVDTFIEMALEGRETPTPEAVADRAGVSRATFFRYFSTLGELRNEATARVMERFPELFTIPGIGTGSLEQRIRRFVDVRVQLHETLHPLELLTRTHADCDAATGEFIDATRLSLADQALRHFDTELRSLSPAQRDDMVIAIAVLTSVESWQQFRETHHRSVSQTRRAWRTALARVLTDLPASNPDDGAPRAY